METYVHVDHLPIASTAADDGSDDDQGISVDKIPHAPLVLTAVTCLGHQIEFQCIGEG